MLVAAWRGRDFGEVAGEVLRMPTSMLFSRLWIPMGYNGRA